MTPEERIADIERRLVDLETAFALVVSGVEAGPQVDPDPTGVLAAMSRAQAKRLGGT